MIHPATRAFRPAGAAAFILLLAVGAESPGAEPARPNVVLCMADDQGWGDVGYNGHPRLKTPVLDEMAAAGLRFDRFYAAAPVCSPTRGSVLTGRHPNRYGCFSWGRLRKELDALGVRRDTLLWYTSDNGAQGPGSTGGLRGKKGSLWEGGVRVPAIIEWPARIRSPARTGVPCGTVDIYPTVLDLAGVKVARQAPLDGVSLVPLLDGKMTGRDKPMGFWVYPQPGHGTPSAKWLLAMRDEEKDGKLAGPDAPWEGRPWTAKVPQTDRAGHAAWLDGQYKLHRIPQKSGEVRFELYDLAADPKEERDVAKGSPGRCPGLSSLSPSG